MSNFEELPMPPDTPYGVVQWNFFTYVWDTTGIPLEETIQTPVGEVAVITPQFGRLVIYGRKVCSPYEEDAAIEAMELERGRVLGEWFSTACMEGECGFVRLDVCRQITAAEFSAAYQRGWKED